MLWGGGADMYRNGMYRSMYVYTSLDKVCHQQGTGCWGGRERPGHWGGRERREKVLGNPLDNKCV